MSPNEKLAAIFEQDRPRLRRIAQRILGDWDQADEAVQESWLKIDKYPHEDIRNVGALLTTVTTRVCLDSLRHRRRRAAMHAIALDDPANENEVAQLVGDEGPEQAALLADSIGVALLIVLDRLSPLERVSFVLHDIFSLPFDEIAGLIDRTPEAARQLASRARRRLPGNAKCDGKIIAQHRELTEAFLRAAREGDLAGLLNILDPDVVLTADECAARLGSGRSLSGSDQVAHFFAGRAAAAHIALIDGDVGIIVAPADQLLLAVLPRFSNGGITHLHAIASPEDLARLEMGLLDEPTSQPALEEEHD